MPPKNMDENGSPSMTDQRASNDRVNFPDRHALHLGRVCGFGLLAVLAAVNEAPAQETMSRLRFPSLFRKTEPTPPPPQVTPASRRDSENSRALARARQLMTEARTQEAGGRIDLALDLASRAEGVYQAAQRTMDARWPANDQSPAEYVRLLEKRLLASAQVTANSGATDVEDSGTESLSPNEISRPATPSRVIVKAPVKTGFASDFQELKSDFGKTQRPTAAKDLPEPEATPDDVAANNFLPASNTLIDWTKRGRQVLQTVNAVKDVAELVTGEPDLTEPELPDSKAVVATPTKADRSLNTAKSVLDRLDHLNSWQPASAEVPAKGELPASDEHGEPPLPDDSRRGASSPRSPATIPELIDSPNGISDGQVGPIPTHFDWKMDDRSKGLEVGAPEKFSGSGESRSVDAKSDIDPHGAALLLPQLGASKTDSTVTSSVAPRSLWVVGTVQTIATFFGVLGAIATVLFLKSLARQKQGAAVTAVKAAATQPATVAASAAKSSDPSTVPFRVVSAENPKSKTTTAAAQSESPERYVFDQNVELLESLNNLPKQKAA